MNIIDRLLLFVFSIIVAICSIAFLILALPLIPAQYDEAMRRFIFESSGMALISIVLLMLSLRFIFKVTSSGVNSYNYISKQTEMGEIRISFNTLKSIALSGIRDINAVSDAKAEIYDSKGEVSIMINAAFKAGTQIPEASKEIQKRIKELIEATTEIIVKEVVVTVDEANNSLKRRVG